MNMEPTVGRIVWYRPVPHGPHIEPQAAIVTGVHQIGIEGYGLDLCVFVPGGPVIHPVRVPLLGGEDARASDYQGSYCQWMPYQVAKAAAGDHASESAEPRPV